MAESLEQEHRLLHRCNDTVIGQIRIENACSIIATGEKQSRKRRLHSRLGN